jgi:hypothetical protein
MYATRSTRDAGAAHEFMADVASRLRGRVQLTTDDHTPYLEAVEGAFGADNDYATLTKLYGVDPQGEKRYSVGAAGVGARWQSRMISARPVLKMTHARTAGARCVKLR